MELNLKGAGMEMDDYTVCRKRKSWPRIRKTICIKKCKHWDIIFEECIYKKGKK